MSEQQSQQEAPIQQETPSEQDIQAEIEQTRERLGETVEELVAKADVKTRAKDKAAELKAKAQVKAADVKTKAQVKAAGVKTAAQEKAAGVSRNDLVQRRWPVAAAVGAVVVAGLIIVWRRASR
ncbi:MAG TPA: DUF3618 domain-containing protein [Streptosporangiaceae bacterium]|nr:DUF3618 domain-containing protein [Streptosporangiaceae bacterium]